MNDALRLAYFLGEQFKLRFWHPTHIDLNMNFGIGAEIRDDSTRNKIQALEPLNDMSDGGGIRVSNDSKTK